MKEWQVWVVACTGLVALVAGVRDREHDGPPSGDVQNVRAMEGGDAIVLWRGDDAHHTAILSRVDERGTTRWWRRLPEAAMTGEALSVGEGVIAVRYSHEHDSRHVEQGVIAYSLDGEQRWKRSLGMSSDGGDYDKPYLDAMARNQIIHRGQLLAWADNGESVVQSSIDLATGDKVDRIGIERRWATFAFDAHLVEDELFRATSMDLVTGAQTSLMTRGHGCRTGNDFVAVDTSNRLVSAPGGDFANRVVLAADFRPLGDAYFYVRSCGVYGDKLVFLLETSGGEPFHEQSFIAIATHAGEVVRAFSLGNSLSRMERPLSTRHVDRVLVGGRVPRFVPFAEAWTAADGSLQSRLIIADLETATVAEGPINDVTWNADVFRDGTRWYVRFDNTVAVLDGETGTLVAAVGIPHAPLLEELLPDHIGNGRLWLPSYGTRSVDSPPLAVLDASDLHVIRANGLPIRDLSSQIRATLLPGGAESPSTRDP